MLSAANPIWVLMAAAVVAAAGLARVCLGPRIARDVHRRGTIVKARRGVNARARRKYRNREATPVRLAGMPLRLEDETKHFKLIGTTGTGKSTAIRELLRGALLRGDRAVVADPDGHYLERFYDRYRGDVILNPFEPHSVRWDPFAEARTPSEYEELARGLIPEVDDAAGREWRGYARTFLSAVLRRCAVGGQRDVAVLWRLLVMAPPEDLRRFLVGTAAQTFLEPENARMFGSIRSVAVSAVAALEHIRLQRAAPFSVRQWVTAGRGVLFIPYRASQIAALRSIIGTWMRLAIFEAMLRGENDARPLWYVIDELDALGAIDGLKDALARLRKFGGRCVLSFQALSQLGATYGVGDAQTLIENCGNTLILRCSASEHGGTSQFASRLIGEREIVRRHTARARDLGHTLSRGAPRRSTQVSELHTTEMAVMPSEIEQLPDFRGYLKIASAPHWVLVRLVPERPTDPWRSTTSA